MNWTRIILDLQARGFTLEDIATECEFASKGAVHDLKEGRAKSCIYERGVSLVDLHRRTARKKVTRPQFLNEQPKGSQK